MTLKIITTKAGVMFDKGEVFEVAPHLYLKHLFTVASGNRIGIHIPKADTKIFKEGE